VSTLLCPECGSGGAHEAWCSWRPECLVFWGSHGCSLPKGHDDPERHVCGHDDPDGPCSKIERELDEVTGTEVWVWRFADYDIAEDRDTWGDDAFTVAPFGEDVPEKYQVTAEEEQALREAWRAAGKVATWVEGSGWVKLTPGG